MIWRGLLASRARMFANRFRGGAGPHGRWRTLLGLILFAWFFALVFLTLAATLTHFRAMGLGSVHAAGLLAVALAGALTGVLVFDLQYAVSAVLLDSDLDLLRRAPVTPGQLLGIKVVDSLPRTAALIGAVALPACLAFAAVTGLAPWGWLLLPWLLIGLWATPLGLGLAGALLVLRVVPAARAREALAVLSTLVLLGLWMLNSFVMPQLFDEQGDLAHQLIERLTPSAWVMELSPPHWMAGALLAAHHGQPFEALGWAGRLALGAFASLALAAFAARRLLDDVLARIAAGESLGRRIARATGAPVGGFRALLLKDARLFTRDWAVLGDIITAALLWTLLPLVSGPVHQAPPALLGRFMLVALAVGLGYEIGARTLPYEGEALAWSRLAPLSPWRWNAAKWVSGGLISLPLVAIAALVVRFSLPMDWSRWLASVVAALSALALSLALGLWTGWKFGDPRWTNPRAMLTLPGRLLASGLLILQAGGWIGALAAGDLFRDHLPPGWTWWGPPALAALFGVPVFALAVKTGERHEWLG